MQSDAVNRVTPIGRQVMVWGPAGSGVVFQRTTTGYVQVAFNCETSLIKLNYYKFKLPCTIKINLYFHNKQVERFYWSRCYAHFLKHFKKQVIARDTRTKKVHMFFWSDSAKKKKKYFQYKIINDKRVISMNDLSILAIAFMVYACRECWSCYSYVLLLREF